MPFAPQVWCKDHFAILDYKISNFDNRTKFVQHVLRYALKVINVISLANHFILGFVISVCSICHSITPYHMLHQSVCLFVWFDALCFSQHLWLCRDGQSVHLTTRFS